MRLTEYKILVNELMMVIPDQDKWKLKTIFKGFKEQNTLLKGKSV